MSKKKDRSWFICPRWVELVSPQYPDDAAAARALRGDPKVLARLRQRMPVAKSTALKMLRRFGGLHPMDTSVDALIVDTRLR